jgi:hypothetical protein
MVKIFIGYDRKESIAWHTLVNSIIRQSYHPVSIIPLSLRGVSKVFSRPQDPRQSNEFSFSRFLVPFLSGFQGHSIYMDCDMLVRGDINDIFLELNKNPSCAVHVVKHDYSPRQNVKYLGAVQYQYPRKNWSSFVVWNCAHSKNRVLTPEFVQSQPGSVLHRFSWLEDFEIGEINRKWNWLVGEFDDPPDDLRVIHWTNGGPYFSELSDIEFSAEWGQELEETLFCEQIANSGSK